jgi:hypothetical protein
VTGDEGHEVSPRKGRGECVFRRCEDLSTLRRRWRNGGVVREGRSNLKRGLQSRVMILTKTSTKNEDESTRGSYMTGGVVAQLVVEGERPARKRKEEKTVDFTAGRGSERYGVTSDSGGQPRALYGKCIFYPQSHGSEPTARLTS